MKLDGVKVAAGYRIVQPKESEGVLTLEPKLARALREARAKGHRTAVFLVEGQENASEDGIYRLTAVDGPGEEWLIRRG